MTANLAEDYGELGSASMSICDTATEETASENPTEDEDYGELGSASMSICDTATEEITSESASEDYGEGTASMSSCDTESSSDLLEEGSRPFSAQDSVGAEGGEDTQNSEYEESFESDTRIRE